jgi:hypothetical protein
LNKSNKDRILTLISEQWTGDVPFSQFFTNVMTQNGETDRVLDTHTVESINYLSDETLINSLTDYKVPVTA